MEFSVRFGTPDDLDQVVDFDRSTKKGHLMWKLQNNEIVLAEADGVLLGYVRVEYLWSKYPYIGLIIVRKDRQKQGVGRRMLAFLETDLKHQGIDKLYSSSQVNEPEPQAWHRYMGFEECGVINGINEVHIGEVFFCKKLASINAIE